MPWYSDEQIEEVRSRNDIVDVIGKYVNLKRSGNGYVGLCPFHNEKSPSFSVNPQRQMYKCFGCGVGGNVITFLMEYENFTFPEAMEYLAERINYDLPKQDMTAEKKRERSLKQTLLDINTKVATYYYALLKSPQGKFGYDYLKERGLTDETIQRFGLGFSGQGGYVIYDYLKREGYKDDILRETGLFKMDEKGVYDKFWNRVMFPILDIGNHVIGFGGRVMGDAKPKYLNSPETKLFNKRKNLFGLNYAKLGKRDNFILCEGYMDVIAMHQAGFTNAVASLGTAFTVDQANLIKRYTKEVLLIYDSDEAGIKAALRAIPILRDVGITGRVVSLSPYKDPDEFIKNEGANAFKERLKKAKNTFYFEIDLVASKLDLNDPDEMTKFYHEIAQKLVEFKDKVTRENYLEAVCAKYSLRKDSLRELIIKYGNQISNINNYSHEKKGSKNEKNESGINHFYSLFLSWLIERPGLYPLIKDIIMPSEFFDENYGKVAEMLYEQLEEQNVIPAKIINHFKDVENQKLVAKMFQTDYQVEMDDEEREKAFNELVVRIKEYSIEYRMKHYKSIEELQSLILEKKKWQNPEKLHISLKDG